MTSINKKVVKIEVHMVCNFEYGEVGLHLS